MTRYATYVDDTMFAVVVAEAVGNREIFLMKVFATLPLVAHDDPTERAAEITNLYVGLQLDRDQMHILGVLSELCAYIVGHDRSPYCRTGDNCGSCSGCKLWNVRKTITASVASMVENARLEWTRAKLCPCESEGCELRLPEVGINWGWHRRHNHPDEHPDLFA